MKKRYVWCSENKKFMRLMPNGVLVDEKGETESVIDFKEKVKSLSFFSSDKDRGDGFKPHYSKELGGWISTRGQFKEKCKEKGFSCAGTSEPLKQSEVKSEGLNDADIKDLSDQGVKLSSGEVDFIKAV
jgi:hypothetical protein